MLIKLAARLNKKIAINQAYSFSQSKYFVDNLSLNSYLKEGLLNQRIEELRPFQYEVTIEEKLGFAAKQLRK